MNLLKRLKKGAKVFIPDVIVYRFSSGELGAGKNGVVVAVVPKRDCVYVEVEDDAYEKDIYWYDTSEVVVL